MTYNASTASSIFTDSLKYSLTNLPNLLTYLLTFFTYNHWLHHGTTEYRGISRDVPWHKSLVPPNTITRMWLATLAVGHLGPVDGCRCQRFVIFTEL